MKIKIEFDLPEEQAEYDIAKNAHNYYTVLIDIRDYLREQIKYNNREDLCPIQEMFYEKLEDCGVNLDI